MQLPLLHKFKQRTRVASQGFTLVEMLVVVPLALLVVAGIVSVMIALVGDTIASQTRGSTIYNVQDTLDRIEEDGRLANAFLSTFSLVTSPQGRDGGTGAFSTSSGDIIIAQYATTSDPYDTAREIVYYDNQPNACASTHYQNRALLSKTIYFLNSGTLWRRTIVPSWTTTSGSTNTVCDAPWQRNSCPVGSTLTGVCNTFDEKMLENVTNITVTYYKSDGSTTTNALEAKSFKVAITTSQQVSGETVTVTQDVTTERTADTSEGPPTETPSIRVFNESLNTYNNPILTNFEWDDVQYANLYGVRYRINGGAWQDQGNQTSTRLTVTSARPLDAITVEVTAKNDLGNGSATTYTYNKPLWTTANLENGWACYNESAYDCPSYTMTSAGIVVFRGLAKDGSSTIFSMPEGLRPIQVLMAASAGSGTPTMSRINVHSNGSIIYASGGSNAWVSLNSVRYIADGTVSTSWLTPGYGTGWTDYGGSYSSPRYVKDAVGRTHIYGVIKSGDPTLVNDTMLSINNGYGPEYLGLFTNVTSGGTAAAYGVSESTDRVYSRGIGSSSWMGIATMYVASTSSSTFSSMSLQNSWVNYGGSYAPAGYSKGSDNLVTLRGLIKSGTASNGTIMATIPAGYCPGNHVLATSLGMGSGGAYADQTNARVDIIWNSGNNNCEVRLYSSNPATSNNWISLEGITYLQEH